MLNLIHSINAAHFCFNLIYSGFYGFYGMLETAPLFNHRTFAKLKKLYCLNIYAYTCTHTFISFAHTHTHTPCHAYYYTFLFLDRCSAFIYIHPFCQFDLFSTILKICFHTTSKKRYTSILTHHITNKTPSECVFCCLLHIYILFVLNCISLHESHTEHTFPLKPQQFRCHYLT